MRKALVVLLILGVIVLALLGWVRGQYNGLVAADEAVKTGWSQVENQLQRRYDLIPNLVETVKGYASHERETLQAVTDARSRVGGAGTVDEKIAANQQLSSALSRLLLVVERYPDLKANQNFIQLQDELAGTENRIAVERRRYNELVQTYNVRVRSFPTTIFAGMFGFERATPFESTPEAQTAPKVDFGSGDKEG
ncbi:MAG: LemA family protein [Candidatus Eisenbacteria bacterium]